MVATPSPKPRKPRATLSSARSVPSEASAIALLEIAIRFSLPHHLLRIGVEGIVDDPFGRIERVVVGIIELAEALGEGFEARTLRLAVEPVVGVGAIDDPAEQYEG